jgi:hypothetical protein
MTTSFETEKAKAAHLEHETKKASDRLRVIPGVGSGPMGLTPDAVKQAAEYRAAKLAYDRAFAALQAFNRRFVAQFKREILLERRARAAIRGPGR